MSELQDELTYYLGAIRQMRGVVPEGYAYNSAAHLVLEHGEWFEATSLPDEYEYGVVKHCYTNALETAADHDLTYVEGYAMAMLPVHHAWCVDADGRVIDVTWPVLDEQRRKRAAPEVAYLGVRLPLAVAIDAIFDGSGSVLDDWERDYPILRQPFEEVIAV